MNQLVISRGFFLVASLSIIAVFAGCGTEAGKPVAETEATSPADHDHAMNSGMNDMEKMQMELAKLDPADAESAKQQHFCPVTDQMLGSMGPPRKVDVNGQTVWICCEGCEEKLLSDPETYLAKIKKN